MKEFIVFTNHDRNDTPALFPKRVPKNNQGVTRVRFGVALVLAGIIVAGGALLPFVMPGAQVFRAPTALGETSEVFTDEATPLAVLPAEPNPASNAAVAAALPQEASRSGIGRVIIEKIGVSMPIVEGTNERILLQGAWRYPFGSTPDHNGNTVLFGHRYQYLPPNPKTFFSVDKLSVGDEFSVVWGTQTFRYRVVETKVVSPTDVSVLAPTLTPSVTLITCTPVFTTKSRLVVRGERI